MILQAERDYVKAMKEKPFFVQTTVAAHLAEVLSKEGYEIDEDRVQHVIFRELGDAT